MIILIFSLIEVNWQFTKWNTKLEYYIKIESVSWIMCELCWSFYFDCGCQENWGIELVIAIIPFLEKKIWQNKFGSKLSVI